MGDGAHDMKQGAAILPEALRWLWRDYPQGILVHEPAAKDQPGWDPRGKAFSIVSADKPWQRVGQTYRSVVSPAPDENGNVFFADPEANCIYKSDPEGAVSLFKDHSNGARALRIGPDGRLYASQPRLKRIVSYGSDSAEKIVARDIEADAIAIGKSGVIYFTDKEHRMIGSIDPTGKVRKISVADDMAQPSALALSPDQSLLVVTDSQSRFSWSFQIAADGSPIHGEPFYRLEMPESGWMSGVTGVVEDSIGQAYFATPAGVQLCEANGRVATILNPPEHGAIADLAFGGKERNWLYVAEDNKLFRRQVKIAGTDVANPIKPPKPPL